MCIVLWCGLIILASESLRKSIASLRKKVWHPVGDWFCLVELLLNPVYTIQPVVQAVWQPAVSCKQTSSRLSNQFDNRLDVCIHDTAGCQTGLYNRFKNWLYTRYSRFVKPGLTTGWMFVYTIQPVASCIQTFTGLSNRFDNRLYRVNGALVLWQY